jgi:membrane protein involved in colicin uptake
MGGFTPATSEDIETRMLTDERFKKQQEKVAKELEDRRLSDEQRKIYEDELRAVTEAQAKIKKEDARRAAQDAARQRMIDDEKRLLEEERAKVAKETADLINKLNEEEKIRAQAAVPSDYRSASERADILRVTKGSIYSDSNKPVKDWLDRFFKSNKDGKSIDDKSYENAERKRLLRIGSVQVGTVNNTVLINQGVK